MNRCRLPEQLVELVQRELESKGYFATVTKRPDYYSLKTHSLLTSNASRQQVEIAVSIVKMSEDEWIAETRLECA